MAIEVIWSLNFDDHTLNEKIRCLIAFVSLVKLPSLVYLTVSAYKLDKNELQPDVKLLLSRKITARK